MLALVVGTLLVVAALAYVLYPLLFATRRAESRRDAARDAPYAASGDEDAIVALREIEFDRATGKLSDADYAELKARYTERALDAMRARRHACRRAGRGRRRSGGARLSRAPAELRALRSASGAGRDLLLQLRRVPRREVRGVRARRRGAGAAFCAGCGRQLAA